ncbi:hypothetical protein [Paenibacillus ehimensis]|uniref:hypothetical protein n=1 Tax=Paenibacillus ehimensis TaxID=79264 RepID=UPI00046F7BA1|nr:hypothetical protein [Paenibacillus ehimensis]
MSTNLPAIVNPTIDLPILSSPDEVREHMEENLDGIIPEFPRVKFPSGGGLAFEVPGEDEDDVVKEIVGVVVDQHAVNAYWASKYNGEKNPPDCTSMDGKIGYAPEGANVPWAGSCRDCTGCPFNEYGTGTDEKGNATNGKACKNMKRVAILREGEVFPLIITVPPTSVKPWNKYVVGLTSKLKKTYSVVTRIKLEKDKNKGGIEYSKGVFTKVKDLSKEEVAHLKEYVASIKPVLRNVTIDLTDYNADGPVDISQPADEDIV